MFFDSLNQIRKNSGNFSLWEKQQDERQAQREALYNKRTYSDAELEQAKKYGSTIINAIDVMDNHSESIAENVETTLQPLNVIVPVVTTFATGFLSGKCILNPVFEKIHNERIKLLSEDAAKKLMQDITDYKMKNKIYRNGSSEYLTSKKTAESLKDPELKRQALEYCKKYQKAIKNHKKLGIFGAALIPASLILSHMGINILTTKLQVDSSKVARFQARKALEDPKAFVEYTPEQIAQAQAELDSHPELRKEKKKNKLKNGLISGTFGIIRDNRAYQRDKAKDTDESKLITRPLSEEEIAQAERDKEVIQRTVRLINNEAEKYSENMEVAANVIIGGTPFLGAAVGGVTAWILHKTGFIKKTVDKYLNKTASKETKELYNTLLETQKEKQNSISKKFGVLKKWGNFYESLANDLNMQHNPGMATGEHAIGRNAVPFTKQVKNLGVALMSHNKIGGWIIAGAGSLMTGLVGAIIGMQLQKSSARAGRYTAKRELEKDPRNFIGYTQKDYEEVKDVHNTKKKPSKFKEYALFIPNVIKQFIAYKKYQKHEFKENQLLQEQLQKQDVTEEQLLKAKNLQRKIFNTFEKVDDNSQTYSESMEGAIEIAQPYIWFGGIALMATPFIVFLVRLAKGKISYAQAIKKVTDILGKSSKIANSKLFKKYLKGVEKNIEYVVKNQNVRVKPLGTMLGGTQLYDGSIIKNTETIFKNLKNLPDELAKYDKCEIENFWNNIEQLLSKADFEGKEELLQKIERIKFTPKEEQIEKLRTFVNDTDKVSEILPMDKIQEFFTNTKLDKLSIKDLIKSIEQLSKSPFIPENISRYFSTEKCIKELKSKIEKMSEKEFEKFINDNPMLERLGKIDKKMVIAVLNNTEKAFKNLPKEELEKIMEKCLKTFNEHPDEFVKLVKSGQIASIFRTPALENALVVAGISWTAFSLIITYAIESWLADLQLKAGRLGVMKSLESLDDVRYYANIEKVNA